MEIQTCLHCGTPVMLAADGSCPACRSPEPLNPAATTSSAARRMTAENDRQRQGPPPPATYGVRLARRLAVLVAGILILSFVSIAYQQVTGEQLPRFIHGLIISLIVVSMIPAGR